MTKKLKIGDLEKIKENMRKTSALKLGKVRGRVIVHMGTCGIAAGAREVLAALNGELNKAGIKDVLVSTSGCAGLCSREPMVTVEMTGAPPVKYVSLKPEKMGEIVETHIINGGILRKYALAVGCERTH